MTKNDDDKAAGSSPLTIAVIADRLLVGSLVIAAVVLSALGDREHAGMLIAGALGALAPIGRAAAGGIASGAMRALPLALGVAAGVALSGCGGGAMATAATVGRVSCAVAARAHEACRELGLAPDAPCPLEAGEPKGGAYRGGAVRLGPRARLRGMIYPGGVVLVPDSGDGDGGQSGENEPPR